MCDTFVALANSTADGSVIFGKNTDRDPNEAHEILVIPAADHQPGSVVKCTYIEVPQVEHTFAVLLARPFWIWGAEMGMNEYGVTIGNEALFTKVPYETEKGLIGMDFLRLALERSKTAWEALYKITELLELYGQGGNCGFSKPLYYHNSFLIADPRNAWVLETAGRQWVAKKVTDYYSISNVPSIGKKWDLSSDDLVPYAIDHGWAKKREDVDFARCYGDFLMTTLSDARARQACTSRQLRDAGRKMTVPQAMRILRTHNEGPLRGRQLDWAFLGASVCMHAGGGPVRTIQTVGSMVVHLAPERFTSWVTGTAAPCTSIFKPVWLDAGYPVEDPAPTGKYDPQSLWWRHERLHRAVLADYGTRMNAYASERDSLESSFLEKASACPPSVEARREFSKTCFKMADQSTDLWLSKLLAMPASRSAAFYYQSAWEEINRQAGFDTSSERI